MLATLTLLASAHLAPEEVWTDGGRIRGLYQAAHMAFGCRADPNVCPTWDCAVVQRGLPCDDARRSPDASRSWILCYDKGFRRYYFRTDVCVDGDCCRCDAIRFQDEWRASVCTVCADSGLECYDEL